MIKHINYLSIIYYAFSIISSINMCLIYYNLNNKKKRITVKIFLVSFVISSISLAIYIYNLSYIKAIFTLLLTYILLKFINKEQDNNLFIKIVLVWLLGLLVDLIFSFLFSSANSIIHIDQHTFNILIIILSGVMQIVFYLISNLKIIKKLYKRIFDLIIYIKVNMLLILLEITMLIILSVHIVRNNDNITTIFLLLILFIYILFINIIRIFEKYNNYELKKANENLLENNNYLVNTSLELRKFKHNIIHELDGLLAYDDKYVREYVNTIIEKNCVDNSSHDYVEKLPSGINGFIMRKLSLDRNNELRLIINNFLDMSIFEIINVRQYNKLCTSLGVILDNAIESSLTSEEKILEITLDIKDDNLIITIKNTFNNIIDIDNFGENRYSSKGKSRGLGIFSLLFIKDIKIHNKVINNIFESKIVLKKRK